MFRVVRSCSELFGVIRGVIRVVIRVVIRGDSGLFGLTRGYFRLVTRSSVAIWGHLKHCTKAVGGHSEGRCARAGQRWREGRAGARGALHAMPKCLFSVAAVPRLRVALSKPQPLARKVVCQPWQPWQPLARIAPLRRQKDFKLRAAKRRAQPCRGFDFSLRKAGAPGSPPGKPHPRPCLDRGCTKAARGAPQGISKAKDTPKGSAELVVQKASRAPGGAKRKRQRNAGAVAGAAARAAKKARKSPMAASRVWRMTDEEHKRFHVGFKGFCIRCDVQKNPTLYASWASAAGGPSWLTSGRSSSGMWGLGCKVCAAYLATGRTCKDARISKFANFEVRPASRYVAKWLIRQHHERQSHRVASGVERARPKRAAKPPQPQPLACPIARLAESPPLGGLAAEDAALFKGNVPSQAEWREAWAVLSETVAFRTAGRMRAKERPDIETEHRKRKRYRQQQRVMAEVLRRKNRQVLGQATAICLSLDECKHRKVVRFRADLPSAYCAQPGSHWRVGKKLN